MPKDDLEIELVTLKLLHEFVGPRRVPALLPTRSFARLYSDASYEPTSEKPAVAGFVLFSPRLPKPVGMTCEIKSDVLQAFCPRRQQIAPCEALLGITAPINLAQHLVDCDLIWFIDNTPTCSCLIKGSSSHSDLAAISTMTNLLLASLNCRTYFEYVQSEANCADGLSRGSLTDPWTIQQAWDPSMAKLPDFVLLSKLQIGRAS